LLGHVALPQQTTRYRGTHSIHTNNKASDTTANKMMIDTWLEAGHILLWIIFFVDMLKRLWE
jgi:hypothetical protein